MKQTWNSQMLIPLDQPKSSICNRYSLQTEGTLYSLWGQDEVHKFLMVLLSPTVEILLFPYPWNLSFSSVYHTTGSKK